MKVDKERVSLVLDYVNKSEHYTFEKFARENSLLEDSIRRIDDLVIRCCFQDEDASPSLSLNDKKHVYHCFACGAHGSYVDFLIQYDREVRGIRYSFYEKVNELLREDPAMRAVLGFDTIFVSESLFDTPNLEFKRIKIKRCKWTPSSYLELADYLKKKNSSVEVIRMFVLMMQSGQSPEEIYRILSKDAFSGCVAEDKSFDIDEILKEE